MRSLFIVAALSVGTATSVMAQLPEPTTRQGAIEQTQAEKSKSLKHYVPGKVELFMNRVEDIMVNGVPRWHPFLESAYSGGGFTVGAGYAHHVSPYNMLDARASYSIKSYKRAEMEFTAPRLFHRRGSLSLLGGWREATEVGFYGVGAQTSKSDLTNFGFRQPYGSATLAFWPTRRLLMLRGAVELTQWELEHGQGSFPSVETRYSPAILPGVGAKIDYLHSQGTVGLDWRTSPGYTRRGGFYGVTLHDYKDNDDEFGFREVDYELIQHIPILREAWVLSFHGRARTTLDKGDQQVPFFLMPYVGSGHTLRGYDSHRFRDRNSLLLQAEWRIMVNRFFDLALFTDAGKVAARRADLDFNDLKTDYGLGVRFHGPFSTPLRIEVARSRETTRFIFTTNPIF